MAMTVHDILHDADALRRAYPNWPLSSPEREAPAEAVNPCASPCGHPAGCSCPTPDPTPRLDALAADWDAEMGR